MKCPICSLDLSPLDLISKTEHVDLCLENGPSTLDVDDSGRLVIKKNVPQRIICPICDKTFNKINNHFKNCALKNDVPPNLMLDYWDKINKDCEKPKKFPRDLLDRFVAKAIKEGRLGDQVNFAKALSISMAESDPNYKGPPEENESPHVDVTITRESNQNSNQAGQDQPSTITAPRADVILMQNAASMSLPTAGSSTRSNAKKFRIELVDEATKQANIELRIERELAATSERRYREALAASRRDVSSQDGDVNDEVVFVADPITSEEVDFNKLFFRARLKSCTNDLSCYRGECGKDHDLILMMDEFAVYSGTSMDADPKRLD